MSKLFSENLLIGSSYAEPYAGGSGLALKLLFNEFVNKIYINDLDKSIYLFWKSVLEHNLLFCDWLEDIEVNLENWFYYKSILQNPGGFSDLEIAKSTFYLNRTNISGVIKGGIIGGQSQKGKYKIDARFNKQDLLKRIERLSKFKARINVSNLDGVNFIKKMNRLTENVFIYIDPPYVQKGADLYMNYYSQEDHKYLAQNVDLIKKNWLVSYDNHEFILNLYSKQRKVLYQLSQAASNRVGDEILIFSDRLNFSESIYKLQSPILL
jgi:DNA adenine methylase